MKWHLAFALVALLGLLSACGEEDSNDQNDGDSDVDQQQMANCDQSSWLGFPDYISGQSSSVCVDTDRDDDQAYAPFDRDDLSTGARSIEACATDSSMANFDWSCIRSYWVDRLEERCAQWASGDASALERASEDEYNKYCN